MLYQELVVFRNQFAQDLSIPPFTVASNKLLGDLCVTRPADTRQLRNIDGVSDQWIHRFSEKFLGKIKTFCDQNTLLKLGSQTEEVDSQSDMIEV